MGEDLGKAFYETLNGFTAIIGGILAEVEHRFDARYDYAVASTLTGSLARSPPSLHAQHTRVLSHTRRSLSTPTHACSLVEPRARAPPRAYAAGLSRLKECTALVRGFLMGITALLAEGVPGLPPNAFAHLVIITHQQRAHVLTLNTTAPSNLLPIVRTCFALDSPQLAEIQWKLESEFDVHALRKSLTVMNCWQLYTEHIEKLRQAEVDLASEVERNAVFVRDETRQLTSTVLHVAAALALAATETDAIASEGMDVAALASSLAQVPAERLKSEILHQLRALTNGDTPTSPNHPPSPHHPPASPIPNPSLGDLAAAAANAAAGHTNPAAARRSPRGDSSALQRPPSSANELAEGDATSPAAEATEMDPIEISPSYLHVDTTNGHEAAGGAMASGATAGGAIASGATAGGVGSASSGAAAASANGGSGNTPSNAVLLSAHQLCPPGATVPPCGSAAEAAVAAHSRRMRHSRRADDKAAASTSAVAGRADDEWRIDWSEVLLDRLIGSGAAGMTYAATWHGATVAVKIATPCASGRESWRAEVRALTRLHHPNVVRCMGTVVAPPTYCLVLEYCDGGDVREALHRPTPPNFFWRVAEGVANGMAYLHRKGVLHCDLKTSNILIDRSGGVRVTDFGLAVNLPDRALAANGMGTLRYMAPEVVRREPYVAATDVYGFALVLFELITREIPFDGWAAERVSALVALRGRRPRLPADTPPMIEEMVQACWGDKPVTRPSFIHVQQQLQRSRDGLSANDLAWLDAAEGHCSPRVTTEVNDGSSNGGLFTEPSFARGRTSEGASPAAARAP